MIRLCLLVTFLMVLSQLIHPLYSVFYSDNTSIDRRQFSNSVSGVTKHRSLLVAFVCLDTYRLGWFNLETQWFYFKQNYFLMVVFKFCECLFMFYRIQELVLVFQMEIRLGFSFDYSGLGNINFWKITLRFSNLRIK
jgi:hypothetical protein